MNSQEIQRCWKLLYRNTDLFRDLIEKYHPIGNIGQITVSQIKIMNCILDHEPNGIMLKDLAGELDLTPGAVSQAVEHLVRDGFVERCTSETDRRAVCIKLSPEGKKIRARNKVFFDRLTAAFLDTLPEEKQTVFIEVLEGLHEYLKNEKIKYGAK